MANPTCCNAPCLVWHHADGDILCKNCGVVHDRILDDRMSNYEGHNHAEELPAPPKPEPTPATMYADASRGFTANHFGTPTRKFWKTAEAVDTSTPRHPEAIIKRLVYEYDDIPAPQKWPLIKRATNVWVSCPAIVKQSCKLDKLCVRIIWAAEPPNIAKKDFCQHFKISPATIARRLF